MLLVDTNVLIDVLTDDQTWAEWSLQALRVQSKVHRLAINSIIYAELSTAFASIEELDHTLADMALDVLEVPRPALFLAGKAFVQYRRRGGTKSSVLPDFLIGAHAAVARCPILTRDCSRYQTYFPTVELLLPEGA